MKDQTKEKGEEYSCAECANAATEICELCKAIVTPSGKKKKPSRYIEMAAFNFDTVRLDALVHMIGRQINVGGSIPLAWVNEYNERVARCERELMAEIAKTKFQPISEFED